MTQQADRLNAAITGRYRMSANARRAALRTDPRFKEIMKKARR